MVSYKIIYSSWVPTRSQRRICCGITRQLYRRRSSSDPVFGQYGLLQVQKRRNPRGCHATTGAGCTRTSTGRHGVQIPENLEESLGFGEEEARAARAVAS